MGRVQGLCGDYDGVADSPFTTALGDHTTSAIEFGNSWNIAPGQCADAPENLIHPCVSAGTHQP